MNNTELSGVLRSQNISDALRFSATVTLVSANIHKHKKLNYSFLLRLIFIEKSLVCIKGAKGGKVI